MLRILIVGIVSFAFLLLWLSPATSPPVWVVIALDAWRIVVWQLSWLVPITVMAAIPTVAAFLLRRKGVPTFVVSFAAFLGLTIWFLPSLFTIPKVTSSLSATAWLALELSAVVLWLAVRLRIHRPHLLRRRPLRRFYSWLTRRARELVQSSPFLTQFLVSWPHAVLLAKVRKWPWLHDALKWIFDSRPAKALRRTKAIGWSWSPREQQQSSPKPPAARHIVICFDGTWNHRDQIEKGLSVPTNVYRLWDVLAGSQVEGQSTATLDKRLGSPAGTAQIALYYGGIGNPGESSKLREWIGGATGLGEGAIRDRAYKDLITLYQPGDTLYVFGFSRGAASARMFTECIEKRGMPERAVTLSVAGRVLSVFRQEPLPNHIGAPGKVRIRELGIWDTVGSFVVARRSFQKILPGKSLDVSWVVDRAIHMVAIDETRIAFEPTLLNQDSTNKRQEVWFSGVHSNVGGGHSDQRLADITLEYLMQHLQDRNELEFRADWMQYLKLNPDPFGEVRKNTGIFQHGYRRLPPDAQIHPTVRLRLQPNRADVPRALLEHAKLCAECARHAQFIRDNLRP